MIMFNFHSLKQPMVLILDCYSEHVLHAGRKVGIFGEKNRFVHFLDLINASNRGNKRDFSLRAHLFHLLPSNIGPWTSLVVLCKISKFTLRTPVQIEDLFLLQNAALRTTLEACLSVYRQNEMFYMRGVHF